MKILAGLIGLCLVAGVFAFAALSPSVPKQARADVQAREGAGPEPSGTRPAGSDATAAILPDQLPAIEIRGAPSFMQRFDEPLEPEGWFKANFVYRSQTQRAGWSKENIIESDAGLTLRLTREPKAFQPYSGAEINRTKKYHYGRYEVVMRGAPGSGVVSSFFTHTNEYFGDPHNEIDFEFLGYDTAMVQLNYYSESGNMQGHLVDLPYDAAEHYQLYAFEWMPEHIDWFIGDQHVLRATEASTGLVIPHRPSRLMMNIWSGSERQYKWHGEPTFESGTSAHYLCVSYKAPGDEAAAQCSDWFVADVPALGAAPKADARH